MKTPGMKIACHTVQSGINLLGDKSTSTCADLVGPWEAKDAAKTTAPLMLSMVKARAAVRANG